MSEQRYKINEIKNVDPDITPNYYIEDTTKPIEYLGNKIGNDHICTCYEEEKAKLACEALNMKDELTY